MNEETVKRILDAVQNSAPKVWEAAYRQARIDAFEYLAFFLILSLATVAFAAIFKKLYVEYRNENSTWDADLCFGGMTALWVLGVLSLWGSIAMLFSAISNLANPDMAAIEIILRLVSKK